MKHWISAGLLLLAAFVALNLIARNQARAMTEFVRDGERTARPEALSMWEKVRVLLLGVEIPRPRNRVKPADQGVPFAEVRFPNGLGDTLSAWAIEADDPVGLVILFHGYAASKESLLPTALELRKMKLASLLVDFYGSGNSSGSGTTIGMRESQDVVAAVAAARRRWPGRRVYLYGFSMGGAAILRAVAEQGVAPDGIIIESVFDRLINAAGARFQAMGLPPRPLADILLFWGGRQWGFDPFTHDPEAFARSVRCPTLLIAGDADRRVALEQTQGVYANLAGPKNLLVIAGMGHQSAVSVAPERWGKAVGSFFEATESAAGRVP